MTASAFVRDPAAVEPWPSERPLFALSLVVALVLWLLAIITIIGIVYAAFLGLFFFVMHLGFIAHVRGSAVRLGPDQFPELHADVERMARKMGLAEVPETYVMQAGGTLNAFATRFLGANIVVLFSDLLDACGDNRAARDMIIAHELGHVKAGHLKWHWIILPAYLVPFLGSALSRAREYTCDRFGLAGAGELDGALTGLTILAAGATHGPKVNRQALVRQRLAMAGTWMTLGQWLASHPPLARRLLALDPRLGGGERVPVTGTLAAAALVLMIFGGLGASGVAMAVAMPKWAALQARQGGVLQPAGTAPADSLEPAAAVLLAHAEMDRLVRFMESERSAGRELPTDLDELYARWQLANAGAAPPIDPYDGLQFGYTADTNGYTIWSSGPDRTPRTEDDLEQRVARDAAHAPH